MMSDDAQTESAQLKAYAVPIKISLHRRLTPIDQIPFHLILS